MSSSSAIDLFFLMSFSPHLSARLIPFFDCSSQYSTGISTVPATSLPKFPSSLFSKEIFFQLLFLHGHEAQGAEEPKRFPMEAPALGDKTTFWEATAKSFGFPGSKQPFDVMKILWREVLDVPAAFISSRESLIHQGWKRSPKSSSPTKQASAPVPTQPCHQVPPLLRVISQWSCLNSVPLWGFGYFGF